MPAVDALGQDPCSLLNRNPDFFKNLWIGLTDSDSDTFPRIVASGKLKTYQSFLATIHSAGQLTNTMLLPSAFQPNSTFSLLQFLSGGGVSASMPGVDFKTMRDIVLRSSPSAAPETIVDNYFGLGDNYTYSTNQSPKLTESALQNVLNGLLNAGYLIKETELYSANPRGTGLETLVELYQIQSARVNTMSDQQRMRQLTLEAKNLRFFAAFLAEYCFYRTRYEWLLTKYFNVFTQPYTSPTPGSPPFQLFSGTGTAESQYQLVNGQLPQSDYLKGIAYAMACLNTRMTDMRRLLAAINTYYTNIFNRIQNTVNDTSANGSNADLQRKILALNESAAEAKKYMTDLDFRKGAMDYASQKNRYANMILGLYAFLNISAIAMILHLSQKS
jgi:hypothetical protein